MRYLFAMLSCGREEYVRRTLAAYAELLDPAPSAVYVYDDGGQTPLDAFNAWDVPVTVESLPYRVGRCAGHANLWRFAAASEFDYVWTVEDDILLLRPLNLRAVAELLELKPQVQQVALVRCPWGSEIYHGGYIPMRAGSDWYIRAGQVSDTGWWLEWIESTRDWTSSPALLRTSLPREVAWPEEAGCEGTLGPRILERHPEAVSAYWGLGEPWTAHIGLERVEGAHGGY